MRRKWSLLIVPILLASWPACGAINYFYGLDASVNSAAALPNSNAAAAAFDAAAGPLGTLNLITFEAQPVNVPVYATSLSLGGGVTALLAGPWTHSTSGITSATGSNPYGRNYGFNVTPGGSHYLELDVTNSASPASVTINFPSPIQAFGAYAGGVGTAGVAGNSIVAKFNDGSSQQYTLVGAPSANGGMMFFGFTDPGAQITSVTIEEAGSFGIIDDSFSLDDIRYVTSGAAPANPAAIPALSGWGLAAMTIALAGVATLALRRAVI